MTIESLSPSKARIHLAWDGDLVACGSSVSEESELDGREHLAVSVDLFDELIEVNGQSAHCWMCLDFTG